MVSRLHNREPVVSLMQLAETWTSSFVLTPRSIEVCAVEGILHEELRFLPREHFDERNTPQKICDIRWKHYEENRRKKIKLLQEVYKNQLLNIERETSRDLTKRESSKISFDVDNSWHASAETSVDSMKRQMESQANRHKQNITKLLLHEFYWQIKFEENHKVVKQIGDDRSQNLDGRSSSLSSSSTAHRNRREQIMLANHRDAERARRAADMRARLEEMQEERRIEYDAHKKILEKKDSARKALLDRQRAALISKNHQKRLDTQKRMQDVLSTQQEQVELERVKLFEKQRAHEEKLLRLQERRQEHWNELQLQAMKRKEHIRDIANLIEQQEMEKKAAYFEKQAAAETCQERLRYLDSVRQYEDEQRQNEFAERAEKRLAALEKAQHDEELKKIQILAKEKAAEENYREEQKKLSEALQIKNEIEALKRKDRLESVLRIRRKEEFAIAGQRRRICEVHNKVSEFEQNKLKEYLDKMHNKQELHLQEELLQAAVETFRKTKKWNPPKGLNFEIDLESIKQQAWDKYHINFARKHPSSKSVTREQSTASNRNDWVSSVIKSDSKTLNQFNEEEDDYMRSQSLVPGDYVPPVVGNSRRPQSARECNSKTSPHETETWLSGKKRPGSARPHALKLRSSNYVSNISDSASVLRVNENNKDQRDHHGFAVHAYDPRQADAIWKSSPADFTYVEENQPENVPISRKQRPYSAHSYSQQNGQHSQWRESDEHSKLQTFRRRPASAKQPGKHFAPIDGNFKENIQHNALVSYDQLNLKDKAKKQMKVLMSDEKHTEELWPQNLKYRFNIKKSACVSVLSTMDKKVRRHNKTIKSKQLANTVFDHFDRDILSNSKRPRHSPKAVFLELNSSSIRERKRILDSLRCQQNEHLLGVLEEEQEREVVRQTVLQRIFDPFEKDRVEAQFTIERLHASERIMELTCLHDQQFSAKMKALSIVR